MPPRRGEIPLVPAEARPLEVRVAFVQAHRAALGDLQDLGEVRGGTGEVGTPAPEGGAGQQAAGDVMLGARPPQAVHRPAQRLGGLGEP